MCVGGGGGGGRVCGGRGGRDHVWGRGEGLSLCAECGQIKTFILIEPYFRLGFLFKRFIFYHVYIEDLFMVQTGFNTVCLFTLAKINQNTSYSGVKDNQAGPAY